MDGTTASTIFSAGFVLLAISMPLVGQLADYVGVDLAIGGTLFVTATGFLGLVSNSSGIGLVRSIFVFLGASGNAITGLLADTAGWKIAYGYIGILVLMGTTIVIVNSGTSIGD